MKASKTETGYKIELTDAEAENIYQFTATKKLMGSLAAGVDPLDTMAVTVAIAVEKATGKSAKKRK